jgi:hypothetical protein
MIDDAVDVPAPRATILVGYGRFGEKILRRLLKSAAPRGVLAWEEPRGGGAPSERHLQDLALLVVPDPSETASRIVDDESINEGSALEMMRDLYRQIEEVRGDRAADDFADALANAAATLLSASGRAGRREGLPLGLDVIAIAHPTTLEVVGTLDHLLVRGMERLANNANLTREVQGAEALNFLAILDFENYWDVSERGRGVRRAVHAWIEQWQKRRQSGKPSFGRFYLVDGRTNDGIREPAHRMDEITLFIELLLFEGQRAGELQRLYQPMGRTESPVATIGIRLMERSAALLSHLAAARFGIGWLDYLAGTATVRDADGPSQLQQLLESYRPAVLDELLDTTVLRNAVDADLASLEEDLTTLSPELPDWPQRVRQSYQETARHLENRLAQTAHSLMAGITGKRLVRLGEELRSGVDAGLHHPANPIPLGGVIAELEQSLRDLEMVPDVAPPSPGEAETALRRIEDLHADYQRFNLERVQVEGLRRWWPLFAVALAAGLTPIVHDLLSEIPKPDPMHFLLDRAFAALQWTNNPLAIGLAIVFAAWAIGAWGLQHSIAGRVRRARRFYVDPERGRLVGSVRGGLAPGGPLRAPLDAQITRVVREMALSVRGEVTRELGRVLDHLRERRREILWLRDQLRGFLRMHAITGEGLKRDMGRLAQDDTGIRYAVERGEDFDAMLRGNPPVLERFRSTQANDAPFAGWDERYCRAFLAPLEFLERLSRIYQDPFQQELARPRNGPEQTRLAEELRRFIERHGSFSLAFNFKAQEGVPPDRRYCLLPSLWRLLPGVPAALQDHRMGEDSVMTGSDRGRAYLLRLQTGVELRCLLEPE